MALSALSLWQAYALALVCQEHRLARRTPLEMLASLAKFERLSRMHLELRKPTLCKAALRVDGQGASQAIAALTIATHSGCEPKPVHLKIGIFL
jgi:hypothetical protein